MLTLEERKQVRRKYGKDNLFKMLYKALFVYSGKSFSPEDVWHEASKAVVQIGEADEDARDIEVQALFSDLPERYGENKEGDVMCVMLTVFFMLLDKHDAVEGHPFMDVCCEIKSALKPMPGFGELYERCREEEDKQEANGKFIEVMDYLDCFISDSQSSNTDINTCNELNKIIEEAKALDVTEMKALELVLSRANDNNGHQYQYILDSLRKMIDEKVGLQYLPSSVNTQGGAFVTGGHFQTGVEFVAQKGIESK
ncbi:MAG: hypothetical protein E7096_01865 [Bacteroides sp.]|nr:hypothetical protein [Bacteroides sp.]